MKTESANNIFHGEIGKNFPSSKGEREEDLLEILYEWQKSGNQLTSLELCSKLDMAKRELNYYLKQMVKHGYLYSPDNKEELYLTEFGKSQGAECRFRHERLAQFFQLIGMEEKQAEEDACRMEHVLSDEATKKICNFLNYGDTYNRVMRKANLYSVYWEGWYEFYMGIYDTEKRYPRILAKEFFSFSDEIALEVKSAGSYFYLKEKDGAEMGSVWYRGDMVWKQAEETKEGYQIPSDIFNFTVCTDDPVTEGDCMIAFPPGKQPPKEEDIRELNVHIW